MMADDNEGFAPAWLAFEKQLGQRLMLGSPLEKALEQYAGFGTLLVSKLTFPAPDLSVKSEDKEISPGLKVRVYTPPNYTQKPVCVFYHGGGWAMGDLEAEDGACRTISKAAGCVIVSVDYRLAPAHPYPTPFNDCYSAYVWALENSSFLNTTPGQAFTFGTSAGGNLALSVALKVVDEGKGETLKGAVAIVPVTVERVEGERLYGEKYTSYKEHDAHTIDTGEAMKMFADAYGGDPKDPYISPLLHPKLKDLPRVYLAVAEMDTLRDDGRLLRDELEKQKVPTMYDEYVGYPHWFWGYPSEHLVDLVKEYERNLKKAFEFVLEESKESSKNLVRV
ncbi:arylacetamide deacetylase [Halenospora varia]|nr:arylacetamide deacetylase [Halenospora varia]